MTLSWWLQWKSWKDVVYLTLGPVTEAAAVRKWKVMGRGDFTQVFFFFFWTPSLKEEAVLSSMLDLLRSCLGWSHCGGRCTEEVGIREWGVSRQSPEGLVDFTCIFHFCVSVSLFLWFLLLLSFVIHDLFLIWCLKFF